MKLFSNNGDDEDIKRCVRMIADAAGNAAHAAFEELARQGYMSGGEIGLMIRDGSDLTFSIGGLVREKIARTIDLISGQVRSISSEAKVSIEPTDGTESLAGAYEVFAAIDPDFVNLKTDVASAPTRRTCVEIFELARDGTFRKILRNLSANLDELCLTQHQIKRFIIDQAADGERWLGNESQPTFFLFRIGREYFVAMISRFRDARLEARICEYSLEYVWSATFRPRFVVPAERRTRPG